MKTRENELHEPIVNTYYKVFGIYGTDVVCAVCDNTLSSISDDPEVLYDNYCPFCGARLKEIDE